MEKMAPSKDIDSTDNRDIYLSLEIHSPDVSKNYLETEFLIESNPRVSNSENLRDSRFFHWNLNYKMKVHITRGAAWPSEDHSL